MSNGQRFLQSTGEVCVLPWAKELLLDTLREQLAFANLDMTRLVREGGVKDKTILALSDSEQDRLTGFDKEFLELHRKTVDQLRPAMSEIDGWDECKPGAPLSKTKMKPTRQSTAFNKCMQEELQGKTGGGPAAQRTRFIKASEICRERLAV